MIKTILLFLFGLNLVNAMQITDDIIFQNIYKQQQNSNKIVLMLYSAKTCPQCAYMKQKVFKNNEVKNFMNKHFILLEKDINKDDLPEGFNYFGIPTMFFVDKEGKQIAKIIGSSRSEAFLKQLKNIMEEK